MSPRIGRLAWLVQQPRQIVEGKRPEGPPRRARVLPGRVSDRLRALRARESPRESRDSQKLQLRMVQSLSGWQFLLSVLLSNKEVSDTKVYAP